MERLDSSRIVIGIFFFLSFTTSIVPFLIGKDLMLCQNYRAFLSLLDKPYLTSSIFARVVLANLDYFQFSFLSLFASLIRVTSFMNLIMLFLSAYLVAAWQEMLMKPYRRAFLIIVGTYLLSYFLIALVLLLGFSITSFGTIITLFRCVGVILMMGHGGIMITAAVVVSKEIHDDYLFFKKKTPLP